MPARWAGLTSTHSWRVPSKQRDLGQFTSLCRWHVIRASNQPLRMLTAILRMYIIEYPYISWWYSFWSCISVHSSITGSLQPSSSERWFLSVVAGTVNLQQCSPTCLSDHLCPQCYAVRLTGEQLVVRRRQCLRLIMSWCIIRAETEQVVSLKRNLIT